MLGPHSNAHGPNEFLHIPMGKRVTACVSHVIHQHALASQRGETLGVAAIAGASSTAGTAAADCLNGGLPRNAWRPRLHGVLTPRHQASAYSTGDGAMFHGFFGYLIGGAIIGVLARILSPARIRSAGS